MKKNQICLLTFLLLMLCIFSSASVLSDFAATVQPGTWALMEDHTTNTSLAEPQLELHYSLLYWGDSGVWDPVNKKILFVGGPGTCCANPAIFQLITYDVESDTWQVQSTPFVGAGHSNDCNAFNPNTGMLYFALSNHNDVKTWDGQSWGALPDVPCNTTTSAGLDWYPDMNNGNGGLVYFGPNGHIVWYNESTSSWIEIPGVRQNPYGNNHIFSQYNPVHKIMWLGEGTVTYKMDADLNLTKLNTTPTSLSSGKTLISVDPVSGIYIIVDHDNKEWWEFDIINDRWTKKTDSLFETTGGNFQVPLPEYGVIFFFCHYWKRKYVYIYKHSEDSKVEALPRRNINGEMINVSPNPFKFSTNITVQFPSAYKNPTLRIFNIQGKLVDDLTSKINNLQSSILNQITWKASQCPRGVYMLKASSGNRTISKRIFIK